MNAFSKSALSKPILPASISNLAMYSSAIMPVFIFRACSWACAVLSQSGSPKFLSMHANSVVSVENVEVWDKTTFVFVLSPNLHYPSMHEREGIQDLHPLVHECVELHGDG